LSLRYQVYCLERNFLAAEDYPDSVETDEHDAKAAHFYAFDEAEELVGYCRLVRAGAGLRFPIENHCGLPASRDGVPPPHQTAEVSRLMVRNDYRRRRSDTLSGVTAERNNAAFAGDRRRQAPQVLLHLYRQMYAYSVENGIRHFYAAMERPLARSLMRMNFPFKAIGPEIDYYGPVAPYLANLSELEAQLASERAANLRWLQEPWATEAVGLTSSARAAN
jgi:N-acyl amino acid synthase of PEP-CTERM/exosortase system